MFTLTIAEQPTLRYNVLLNGKLQHEGLDITRLKKCCVQYGIDDKRFEQLFRAIAIPGKVTVEVSDGRLEQVK